MLEKDSYQTKVKLAADALTGVQFAKNHLPLPPTAYQSLEAMRDYSTCPESSMEIGKLLNLEELDSASKAKSFKKGIEKILTGQVAPQKQLDSLEEFLKLYFGYYFDLVQVSLRK